MLLNGEETEISIVLKSLSRIGQDLLSGSGFLTLKEGKCFHEHIQYINVYKIIFNYISGDIVSAQLKTNGILSDGNGQSSFSGVMLNPTDFSFATKNLKAPEFNRNYASPRGLFEALDNAVKFSGHRVRRDD